MAQAETEEKSAKQEEIVMQTEVRFDPKLQLDEAIKAEIVRVLAKYNDRSVPTRMCEELKEMLDRDFGKGWCVFAGGHLAGCCTFEDLYFTQISFGSYTIIIFRTYVPQK
jgi:hypothetical protein